MEPWLKSYSTCVTSTRPCIQTLVPAREKKEKANLDRALGSHGQVPGWEEQRDFEVTHGTPPPRSSLASPMTLVVLPMPLGKNTATLPLPALLACLAECWPGHSIQVWPQGTRG
jgi:hypothetical protein